MRINAVTSARSFGVAALGFGIDVLPALILPDISAVQGKYWTLYPDGPKHPSRSRTDPIFQASFSRLSFLHRTLATAH